jgi:hypothetical protein
MFDKFSRKPLVESLAFSVIVSEPIFRPTSDNVSVVVVAFAYRLLLLGFSRKRLRKELENQKLQAELSFLKLQVTRIFCSMR